MIIVEIMVCAPIVIFICVLLVSTLCSFIDLRIVEKEMEKFDNNENKKLVVEHMKICNELNQIYEKKNHDYGNSFGETYGKLGIISAVTRISDKYNRLANLCRIEDTKVDESIEDTLIDMANYCIMTVMEMRK